MKKLIGLLIIACLPQILGAQELIDKIDIVGNERVTRETILYYLQSREGDYYSEEVLKKDFRVLWSTGFFANIQIDEENGARGKIVKIIVEENPLIKAISYKTGKKVKEDDIVNKLKEKDAYLLPYSYYSAYKAQKIKKVIIDLLAEKGLQAAKVEALTEKKGKSEVDVQFRIDEGPKVRVGEIVFVGRPKIPEGILRDAMKSNKQHDFISWIAGKDVFKENKISEDLGLIKKKLQEYGYMEASVGEPRIEEITKRTVLFKKQKMMKLIIPVNPGYLYRVGEVAVEGNKAINAKYLRSLIKFQKSQIYSTKIREKSVEDIAEAYRNVGFLYIQVMPVESLDPKHKVVNVNYNIVENEVAYLNRLEFRGNTYTKDKVIRREMLLREGDQFSLALFKDSILRIKQLGLVDLEKEPDIKPDPENPTRINAIINVKELQRNNIQFTAGYSGYEGTFVAMSYSTVNFLGAGETLEVTAQYGKRIKNYVFGFTEPYFLDLPATVGFNIYDRNIFMMDLYDQRAKGIDLNIGARIIGYWRANLTYSYQYLNISPPSYTDEFYVADDPVYGSLIGFGHYNVSSLSPTIYRSTIDSPLTPTRGTMYLASLMYAGSFLGGEVSLVKPHLEWTYYKPVIRNQSVGLHVNYEFIRPIGNSQIPYWQRFFLGGERNIRGYDIYSIGPRSEGGTNIGGEKSLYFNAEYIIQVGGPLYLIMFYDRGNAYTQEQKISLKNMYSSAGVEARIFVPALRVPFRLIFAYNNPTAYRGDTNFAFRFAIGTTF